MLDIITKGEWESNSKNSAARIDAVYGVGIHWEGPKMGIHTPTEYYAIVRGIERFHEQTRGWDDIAYSYLVSPHGQVFEGRGLGKRTAANGTEWGNDHFYAACYLGGEGDPFTDKAKVAYNELIAYLRQHGAGPDVRPHSSFKSTACPGNDIRAWIAAGRPTPGGVVITPQPAPGGNTVQFGRGAVTRKGGGGWIYSADGGVYAVGGAPFFGSMGGKPMAAPVVDMEPTPTGLGYWLIGEDGGIFAFGDAPGIKPYLPLQGEYKTGIRKIAGSYFRGDAANRATWGLTLWSDRLEAYNLSQS